MAMRSIAPTILHLCMSGLLLLLPACNGVFSDLYDTPPPEERTATFGFRNHDEATHRGQLYLDVVSYREWTFIDLHRRATVTTPIPTGLTSKWDGRSGWSYHQVTWPDTYEERDVVPADSVPEPEAWDFALHHYDVRTHNGAALATEFTSLDELLAHGDRAELLARPFTGDVDTRHYAYYDLTGIYNYYIGYHHTKVNLLLSEWMDMNVKNPPPTYTLSRRVYLLRLPDGTHAALHFRDYMSPAGAKGYVTIDYVYPY